MIIKAGTYRWKEDVQDTSPNLYNANINILIPQFSVTEDGLNVIVNIGEFNKIILTGTRIGYYNQTEDYNDVAITITADGESNTMYYKAFWVCYDGEWSLKAGGQSSVDITFGFDCKTFIITSDADVDNDFYTHFTTNTTMLIEAGTYRWNDDLTEPEDYSSINASFSENVVKWVGESSVDGHTISIDLSVLTIRYSSTYNFFYDVVGSISYDGVPETTTEPTAFPVRSNIEGWAETFGPGLTGQIITITEDTYVPTNFGLWAVANWQPYTEPTPTDNTTITITYKGSPIITITNGVMLNADGEPVTKATIPTESYKLDSNIELTITNS